MIKPERISYDDFIKSITMFWIDRNLEETMQKEVDEFVDAMETKQIGRASCRERVS